jgi:hypothetical protein
VLPVNGGTEFPEEDEYINVDSVGSFGSKLAVGLHKSDGAGALGATYV